MRQRPAFLLLLLVLLTALAQPLCLCSAALGARSDQDSAAAGCCGTEDERPPSSPCGEHGDACECGHETQLVAHEGETSAQAGPLVALALELRAPAFLRVISRESSALPGARAPAPPDRASLLPLRI
jgi:hypothetical protein